MRDWFFAVKGLFFEIKTVVTVQITIGTARFRHHMKSTRWNPLQHGRLCLKSSFNKLGVAKSYRGAMRYYAFIAKESVSLNTKIEMKTPPAGFKIGHSERLEPDPTGSQPVALPVAYSSKYCFLNF